MDGGNRLGFFDIDSFISHPLLDPQYVNIQDFVRHREQIAPNVTSPLALADQLQQDADQSTRVMADVRAKQTLSATAECEITDIIAWSAYGRYFAKKLRGGVALERFRNAGDETQKAEAIAALERAAEAWRELTAAVEKYNQREIFTLAPQRFSWSGQLPAVLHDIEIARAARLAPHAP